MKEAVRALYPDVLKFFRTKLPEPDCYDQAHETIRAYLAIDPARITGDPRAYLIGVARKFLLKYFSRRRPTQQFDSTMMSISGMGTSLSVRLDRRNQLLNALRTLALDEMIAIEQHVLEGRTLEETASVLDVSRATATRRIAEGKRKLALAITGSESAFGADLVAELRAAYLNA